MTAAEYNKKIQDLEQEHEKATFKVKKQYVDEMNLYPVGSIVTDHIGMIKVESIKVGRDQGLPIPVYFGPELRKDKTPRKDGSKRQVWYQNIKKNESSI